MLHVAHSWTERANIKFWPQAVDYAVWVFNRLPSVDVVSPNELWYQTRCAHEDFNRAHVFDCPIALPGKATTEHL